MRRTESRASSSPSHRSTKPRDNPSESAEIEMIAREYQGYWRPSFTSKLPSTAAICGSMLLTARLPALKADESKITQNEQLKERARSLCDILGTAEDPDEALDALRASSLESIVVALRISLDTAQIPMVPEKTSWAIFQKIAQAKTRPEKLPDLWPNVSKLFKKVPQETLVVIMFLLAIARRLRSRGLSVDGRSPAVYLLQGLWPRYLGDDVSKLLLLHYDEIPTDLPLTVESVNYRFSGRRCNLLALVANRRGIPEQGIREIRPSEDRQVEW
ncbi:hypothetical protein PRZ48_000726 [Zasmidium cellare]|uniref:Uncharacterized protein n=1 Tax=Zasmidium cellare TaxID=395010 RepID=A0ABR0EZS2_ZASCE|nr:hypothetical protein PRZ48_000726 [Zasmidium cellare]